MTLSNDEKENLKALNVPKPGINGRDLIFALLILIIPLILFAPKIYISSQIYYLSRTISKNNNHLDLLQEENKKLKQELEDFRFQQLLRMEP